MKRVLVHVRLRLSRCSSDQRIVLAPWAALRGSLAVACGAGAQPSPRVQCVVAWRPVERCRAL